LSRRFLLQTSSFTSIERILKLSFIKRNIASDGCCSTERILRVGAS